MSETVTSSHSAPVRWAKLVDQTRCIGCHACSTACKSENQVPLDVHRTYVKYVDVGRFPNARRAFQVTRCNQCDEPPCVFACPTAAMHERPDGIVDFDKRVCIGCKACIAACPYDAIFLNPDDRAAEKCNFCAQRLDVGLEPACVVVCPTEAIVVGDLHDGTSRVSQAAGREPLAVRRPEKGTRPKLFYRGAHQATLDPIAARRPAGGLFLWSEQARGPQRVVSGHPDAPNSSAAAVLAYDVTHRAPWDCRVSLYTWTKGIASGAYLVAAALVAAGFASAASPLWLWAAPGLALVFLLVTLGLLISDLTHPARFYMVLTRPQWRSWLARGGVILSLFGLLLAAHLAAAGIGRPAWPSALAWAGLPLAALAAVYTAFLFAQAKARDLWQSPLLPPQLLVQAVAAGGGALVVPALVLEPGAAPRLAAAGGAATLVHLLLLAGELAGTHPTAHARLAAREMTRGRYRHFFRSGTAFQAAGTLAAVVLPESALWAPLVLLGLLAYEHAFVQAGQAVPLA